MDRKPAAKPGLKVPASPAVTRLKAADLRAAKARAQQYREELAAKTAKVEKCGKHRRDRRHDRNG